jgi:hypothetical protein
MTTDNSLENFIEEMLMLQNVPNEVLVANSGLQNDESAE